jgi:sortase A
MRSRVSGIASTALITAGLVVVLDVGMTLAWSEPVSTLHGWLAQREASQQLEEVTERFEARLAARPPAPTRGSPSEDESLDPAEIARLAGLFEDEIENGDAIGRILIPAIDLNFVLIQGTATADLRRGPGHYPETVLPGQRGTVAIAGHRTTYLAPFRRLDELGPEDDVTIEMPYATFTYRFEKQLIVDPTRVGVVRDTDHNRLVLTACHPLYSADQRIVVFARQVGVSPIGDDEEEEPTAPPPDRGRPQPAGQSQEAQDIDEPRDIDEPGLGPALASAGGLLVIAVGMLLLPGRRPGSPRPPV